MIKITVTEYIREKIKDSKLLKTAVGTAAIAVALSGQPAEASDAEIEEPETQMEEQVEESYMENIGLEFGFNVGNVSTNVNMNTDGVMHGEAEDLSTDGWEDVQYGEDDSAMGISGIASINVYDTGDVALGAYGQFGPSKSFESRSQRNINVDEDFLPDTDEAYVRQVADIDISNMQIGAQLQASPEDAPIKITGRVGMSRKSANFNEEMNIRFYDNDDISIDEYTQLAGSGAGVAIGGDISYELFSSDDAAVYVNAGISHSNASIDLDGDVKREVKYGDEIMDGFEQDYDTDMDVSETEFRIGLSGSF